MFWLAYPLSAAAGVAGGLLIALPLARRVRKSKRFRIGATLVAAIFSFATYQDPREREVIQESESETRRKKEKQSGDPPSVDDFEEA